MTKPRRYPECWAYKCARCYKVAFLYFTKPVPGDALQAHACYYPYSKQCAVSGTRIHCDSCQTYMGEPIVTNMIKLEACKRSDSDIPKFKVGDTVRWSASMKSNYNWSGITLEVLSVPENIGDMYIMNASALPAGWPNKNAYKFGGYAYELDLVTSKTLFDKTKRNDGERCMFCGRKTKELALATSITRYCPTCERDKTVPEAKIALDMGSQPMLDSDLSIDEWLEEAVKSLGKP